MIDRLAALIVDESKWLTVSMTVAMLAVAVLLYRHRRSALPTKRRVLAAMNLFFGVTIGYMACGHLLAVTTKLGMGTLEGRVPLLYAIGLTLAVPSWWLVLHTRKILAADEHGRATLLLNGWLAIALLAMGPHNLPLAAPALFNIGYQLHSRRAVGWAIVGIAVVCNLGLFAGSLMFLASGQSFEQFQAGRR